MSCEVQKAKKDTPVSRRRITAALAWTAPVVVASSAAPGAAASAPSQQPSCQPGGRGGFEFARKVEYPYFGYEKDWDSSPDRVLAISGRIAVTSLTGKANGMPAGQVSMRFKTAVRAEFQNTDWRPADASQSPLWKYVGTAGEFADQDGLRFTWHEFSFDGFLTNEPGAGDSESTFRFVCNPSFRRVLPDEQGDEAIGFDSTTVVEVVQRIQDCADRTHAVLTSKTMSREFRDYMELEVQFEDENDVTQDYFTQDDWETD